MTRPVRYSHRDREAIRARVKQLLADKACWQEGGNTINRDTMVTILQSEGFRRPSGENITAEFLSNVIHKVRFGITKKAKSKPLVKVLYSKPTKTATEVAVQEGDSLGIIRKLASAGLDDKTLGAVVRTLI